MTTIQPRMGSTVATVRRNAAPAAPSPRDVQRDALRDLVALASDCAATEARIEQEHRSFTEQADKELEKGQWQTREKYAGLVESARQRHEQQLAEIEAQYESQLVAARDDHERKRRRIDGEHEPVEHKTRQQFEQAVWLADSVLEVAQNQMGQEAKQVREQVKAHTDALDEMEQQGAALLAKYHVTPPAAEAADVAEAPAADPQAEMSAARDAGQRQLGRLRGLVLPRLFVGSWPWICLMLLCVVAAVGAQLFRRTTTPDLRGIGIAVGTTLAAAVVVGLLLRALGHRQLLATYKPLRGSVGRARRLAREFAKRESKRQETKYAEAVRSRDAEVRRIRERAAPVFAAIKQRRTDAMQAADAEYARDLLGIESRHDQGRKDADALLAGEQKSLGQQQAAELEAARKKHETQTQDSRGRYDQSRVALERRLRDGLAHIQSPLGAGPSGNGLAIYDWSDPQWAAWSPPHKFPALVRFGQMQVDLKQIADRSKQNGQVRLELPQPFMVSAALAFPRGASLLVQHDRAGREQAIRILQTIMARLLTSLPAGRARFTIIDPIGLGQNFAGFMHLADHDDALVGTRIWTESDQIEQRLADMTEHMETVIQKYLRNEFATIDDYNSQAGELAEPYRFLVVADFPTAFEGDSYRRLASIAATGARCGVYVLAARDTRIALSQDAQLDDLEAHSVNLVQQGDKFAWKDEVFGQFPLALDGPPPENVLTQLLDRVGRAAKESKRVEVPFDTIAPSPAEFWTGDSTEDLKVPIGRMGATRLQTLRLGRGVAQHALVAGKTGSGKSTLLHALVTNLSMWYAPDQVELYLIDFKKGVEFKTYATHDLPHARAIAVESDREFGVSVLQRLDAELARRGELFRGAGVQDLAGYRRTPQAQAMPRTLLVIDEFQEFFSEDDKLAQDAGLLLDRLVRQGRAFGIHVLLGSQTIGGTSGLARSTIGQMAVRIALQTSEADSQLILGDNNSAARLLSRPGEAIYNDAGGLVEANSPFQVAWLPDERREKYLEEVRKRADAAGASREPPIVFEGNAPADVKKNTRLATLLSASSRPAPPVAVPAWVGEPVAIKEPTAITFRRQSGANLLLVGQQEEQALAVMCSALVSLAAQYPSDKANFYVLDGTPTDSALAGTFERVKAALPHRTKIVEWRAIPETINELAEAFARRQEAEAAGDPSVFLLIYGLQRYRVLRKTDDDFGFSMGGDEQKKASPSKQFADILREGPALGIHVIAWVDTVASLERTLDRSSMREFDHRVLFQMSASDSSNLIDSPAANKLGFYRALAYSEEQGVMEKFRPYALPSAEWLSAVAAALAPRA